MVWKLHNVNVIGRYSVGMSGFSHFMSWVPILTKQNDVVDLLRREGISDNVSEQEVDFLGFFDLIHVCYMSHDLHV
jgi:hypothetical protein